MKSTAARGSKAWAPICLAALLTLLLASVIIAWQTQTDFGRVAVSNAAFPNYNGIAIRAKLLRPDRPGGPARFPGVVYIHGYQNNRETSDAYAIELARRGLVVLSIDAIGRGNSGLPGDPAQPDFDPTYGGRSSLKYLRSLPFVDPDDVGLMGHSLGGGMVYRMALADPSVKAVVFSGFAYTNQAGPDRPRNMLMIFGKWDEFRKRMTGVKDFEAQWMNSPQTRKAIPFPNPRLGVTYGDFAKGTARRVFMPRSIHFQECHNQAAVAQALEWMRQALNPPPEYWIDAQDQIWPIKEWATGAALVCGLFAVMPLGLILLRTRFFRPLRGEPTLGYACPWGSWFKKAALNGLLMWLYLPLILVLFAIHIYVVHVNEAFPLMMVNAIIWWFFWINIIGLGIFIIWYRRHGRAQGVDLADMGVSFSPEGFRLDWGLLGRAALLAAVLSGFAYACEHLLEAVFIVDWRFIFPFANDLTPARARICLIYFPFILTGFILLGMFMHGQLRRPPLGGRLTTLVYWSALNILALVTPLVLMLAVQYVPLFTVGVIPLNGPGGMFVSMLLNVFHIIGILILVIPISTWFFQLTGRVYLGAMVNAALVTWMLVSSQVAAPVPV